MAHLAGGCVRSPTVGIHGTTASLRSSVSSAHEASGATGRSTAAAPFRPIRELCPPCHADAAIELDTNALQRAVAADRRNASRVVGERRAGAASVHRRPGSRDPSPRAAPRLHSSEHLIGVVGSEPLPRPQKGQLPLAGSGSRIAAPLARIRSGDRRRLVKATTPDLTC